MISNKNLKALLIILGIIFVVSTVICNDFSNSSDNLSSDDENSEVNNDKNLKAAKSWVVTGINTELVIDDSGDLGPSNTWAGFNQSHPWCNGAGIWGNPYVIENVTFDCVDFYNWSISIKNSSVPFIINNCTFKNSNQVGLELENVNNSIIKDNFIMDNGHSGIMAVDANNNTVTGNYLRNNGLGPFGGTAGIAFYLDKYRVGGTFYCCNNNISGNTVYDNSRGIGLFASGYGGATIYCHNNSISGNNVTENNDNGISIEIFGGENNGLNDRVYSSNNSITKNNITFNVGCGIEYKVIGEEDAIVYSNFTTISGNIITDNEDEGILARFEGEDTAKVRVNNFNVSGNDIAFNLGNGGMHFDVDEDFGYNNVIEKNINIKGNIITQNSFMGIHIDDVHDMTFLKNSMYGNGIFLEPSLGAAVTGSHYIDTTNTANNKPIYYYTNKKNLGADNFTDAGQVILIDCEDSLITGLDVSNATIGISQLSGENVTIYDNTASYGIFGIFLGVSDKNNVTQNTANNNVVGIQLLLSDENNITQNTANNNLRGIELYLSHYNNLTQNTANNNDIGIRLRESNYTLVSGNTLLGNTICIEQTDCEGNTFIDNVCSIAPPDGNGNGNGKKKKKEEAIPGYDLFILISTIFILIGAIYFISIKKRQYS